MAKRSSLESSIGLSYVSLISLNLKDFLIFPMIFMDLTFSKITNQLFCNMLFALGLFQLLTIRFMLLSLAGKYNNDSVFILIRPISWHITWDVNLDLMIAATLSCYSPFYKYIVGKYINVQLISLFISMWTHEYPFYPKGYNLFLPLFTLMFKQSQIWPVYSPVI